MKLYHFFLVLFLLVACEAACQQHYFRQYAHAEGLVHSFVYDMVQDDNGFMWIGTPNGLYRFDGFVFEHFTVEQGLTENFVARLLKDSQGNIWIGHQNGAVTLMNNEGFTSPVEESENQGSVTDITEDESGSIWITTQKTGLININKDHLINRVTFPNEYESLTHLEHIGGEKFLIGTQESLYLTRYNSVEFSMEILERIEDYPGSKVVDIVPDANLGYVVVSQEDGIYILLSVGAPGEFQLMAIDQNLDGSLDNLQGGLIDENGSLWLYSMGSGLVEYRETVDLLFSRTTRITSDNGLVNDNVRSLFEDLEGNLWIGMYGEGLLRYVDDNIKFFTYNANEEQSIKTTALAGDTTNFLVVTGNRLLRINQIGDTVLNTYELPVNRLGDRVNSAFLDNVGRIWLGYEQSGLYLSSRSGNKFESVFLSNDELANSVNHITGNADYIWVGTKKGLCRISPVSGSMLWFSTDQGLPHNSIKQSYIDSKGRVLIATQCKEIHYINENSEVSVLDHGSLGPFNHMVSLAEDQEGLLWVGTQGNGVWVISDDTVRNYSRVSGLHSDFCYGLAITGEGNPIVSHTGGISLIEPETDNVKTYSQLEGVRSSSEFYPNAVYCDGADIVWFGTSEGLLQYSPGVSRGGKIPPMLQINQVLIDGDTVDHTTGPLLLKAGQYEVTVNYIGISFIHPEMVGYQSQLQGFSRDWSVPTFNRRVTYDRVGHGTYTFMLKAFDENDIVSEIDSGFEFRIQKPFYLTFWFYIIIVVLLAAGLYQVISIKERNHRMVQERLLKNLDEKSKEIIVQEEIIKERRKVVAVLIEAKTKAELSEKLKTSFLQNMSHEIRTPMNAIVGFSQLLKFKGLAEHDRDEFISNITINAESLLHLIDDIIDVSKLESNQLEIKKKICDLNCLIQDLESHYKEELKKVEKEELKLSVIYPSEQGIEVTTDPARLKQVLMKLIDNSVKFTESGEIRFGYKPEGDRIFFFVEDTGIGLSEDKKDVIFDLFRKIEEDKLKLYGGTGLGLTLARYLVHLMGGEIDVESHEGFGSKFFFTIPFIERVNKSES